MSLLTSMMGRSLRSYAAPQCPLAPALVGHHLVQSRAREMTQFRSTKRASHSASIDRSEYQEIRSLVSRDNLWRTLAEDPALAGSVRKLVIVPKTRAWVGSVPEILPAAFKQSPLPESVSDATSTPAHDTQVLEDPQTRVIQALGRSETLLASALRSMNNLEYFEWDAEPPILPRTRTRSDDLSLDGEDADVWTALKTLKSLRHVRAVDLTCDSYVPEWRMRASPRMITSGVWDLEHLHNFEIYMPWKETDHLRLGPFQSSIEPYAPESRYTLLPSKLKRILTRNPELQTLYVGIQNAFMNYEAIDITSVFEGIALPRLRKLELWGLKVAPDTLSAFLSAHTSAGLEHLRMGFATDEENEAYHGLLANAPITLSVGVLPRLKSFQGPDTLRKAIETARGEAMVKEKETEEWSHPVWLTTRPVDNA